MLISQHHATCMAGMSNQAHGGCRGFRHDSRLAHIRDNTKLATKKYFSKTSKSNIDQGYKNTHTSLQSNIPEKDEEMVNTDGCDLSTLQFVLMFN
jgi:hypothetical protein